MGDAAYRVARGDAGAIESVVGDGAVTVCIVPPSLRARVGGVAFAAFAKDRQRSAGEVVAAQGYVAFRVSERYGCWRLDWKPSGSRRRCAVWLP